MQLGSVLIISSITIVTLLVGFVMGYFVCADKKEMENLVLRQMLDDYRKITNGLKK